MRLSTLVIVITLAVFVFPDLVLGEYRAYELRITNTSTGDARTVVSTLDNLQYPVYYPLQASEVIQYVDSWMCYGNMSQFHPICPKPAVLLTPQPPTTVQKAGTTP